MIFRRRNRVDGQRGVTLVELITIVAIIGIVSTGAIPMFMTFVRASETRGAAQELETLLHQARELAIARNTNYTVQINVFPTNQLRFVDTGGTPWVGPGTDALGWRGLTNQARLSNATANPIFTRFGDAVGGTITVQNSQGSSNLGVVVSARGRIRICPPSCPP